MCVSRAYGKVVVSRNFSTDTIRINGINDSIYDSAIDAVLDVERAILHAPQPLSIALIFREQQLRLLSAIPARKPVFT